MRVFLTGATGFIGGGIARALRDRGDEVRALVRSPEKAAELEQAGVELVAGSLADRDAIRSAMEGCDAAIHNAAVYEIGIKKSERPAMYEANVVGTENVLGAALDAKIPKVVYVSTVGVFGNTQGEIVEEGYEHQGDYSSYYEETKVLAHKAAERLIEQGLPCVIVQPGGVYGPDDHSAVGDLIDRFVAGKLPAMVFGDLGFNLVHRDDVVAGVLLALDTGVPGQAYILGGEVTTMRAMIETLAGIVDRRPPRLNLPVTALRVSRPLGPVMGPVLGFPPNFGELISASDGVTYWARHDKAVRELGYAPRPLEQGLRDTLAAEGKLPAKA
jgi:nucleoside-diphosphate-sugar epimerase